MVGGPAVLRVKMPLEVYLSKRKGKGISDARKVDWEPVHSLCLDAESARGRGRGRTRLDYEQPLFFLSPSSEMRETRKWSH